ncbi:MAG TPA: DUF2934 domain-containing protein [Chthoniobacteraceae bacterium]|nr:DUF2934 domain-containing protein [Chthoniobacteraceae bacterium]
MGKKTSTTKPAAPARRAAKVKPAAEKVAVPEPPAAVANGSEPKSVSQPKAAPRPKAAAKAAKPAARRTKKPAYTQDDVALRAYYISERRQTAGVTGDAHADWLEAERQLASEATKPARAKLKTS